ncbi:hypothetical protein CUT44_06885 [Streptomyces carminius]|uniref:Uncharacterized protein n=1 Tax=Streptomyces carminius TaxID=2665496 RepID=A0A2M8M2K0_9ACTN|nr:hypothetical protein [Streptomyces carminius]PJE98429.1 hypothetical protein CUT44_06885 [Streptomyces carminius]
MDSTQQAEESGPDARTRRRVTRLAKEIGRFAAEHGGSTDAHLEYLGQRGVRIVLVAADGEWGDLVAPTREIAEQAAERAGATLHETLDGELAARIRTGPYEWERMAGIQLGGPGGGNR